jgi:hypothetical protein
MRLCLRRITWIGNKDREKEKGYEVGKLQVGSVLESNRGVLPDPINSLIANGEQMKFNI